MGVQLPNCSHKLTAQIVTNMTKTNLAPGSLNPELTHQNKGITKRNPYWSYWILSSLSAKSDRFFPHWDLNMRRHSFHPISVATRPHPWVLDFLSTPIESMLEMHYLSFVFKYKLKVTEWSYRLSSIDKETCFIFHCLIDSSKTWLGRIWYIVRGKSLST